MSDFLAMSDEDFLNSTVEPVQQETTKQQLGEVEEQPLQQQQEYTQPPEPRESIEDLYKPFKANGRDFQVRSLDEAKQLMQMGINYTKKMQELAPNLRYIKTLEKEGLLSDEKLNYLIDISKNNPQAIAKLVKESQVDAYNLDQEQEYVPQNHQVSQESMHLDSVLDSIEHTPTYNRCIDVVGNKWDLDSRTELARNPAMIVHLNQQMAMGIYDKIAPEVERLKVFGALQGMSDLEAYRRVGTEMHQRGLLNQQGAQAKHAAPPVSQPIAKSNPNAVNPVIAQRAAAAAPTQMKHNAQPQQQYKSILAMSDDEFMRMYSQQ